VSIDRLTGIALGCVGMSLDDFARCTPSEFWSICEQWRSMEDGRMRDGWEQTRFVAVAMLQPYSKKTLKPHDVAVFPWEKKKTDNGSAGVARSTPESFRKILDQLGYGNGDVQNKG